MVSSKLHDKDEYLKAIGLVVVQMSSLELSLMYMLGAMLHEDYQLGINLLAGRTLENNLKLIRSVFYSYKQDDSTARLFKTTLDHIEGINTRRNNEVVHPSWNFSPKGDKPALTVKAKQPKAPNTTSAVWTVVELETLTKLIEDVKAAITDVDALRDVYANKHRAELNKRWKEEHPKG